MGLEESYALSEEEPERARPSPLGRGLGREGYALPKKKSLQPVRPGLTGSGEARSGPGPLRKPPPQPITTKLDEVLIALRHLLAPVTLGTTPLLFALLALGDEVHLLAKSLRDSLGDNALIKAADELLDGFAVTTFNTHCSARLACTTT
jgi:hypothetical protein